MNVADERLIRWVSDEIKADKTAIVLPANILTETTEEGLAEVYRLAELNGCKLDIHDLEKEVKAALLHRFLDGDVFLARHGSVEEKYQGIRKGSRLDVSLSNQGKEEALGMAHFVGKHMGLQRIVSSDLKRCVQTAEIVKSHIGRRIKLDFDCRLRERDYGSATGSVSSKKNADIGDYESILSVSVRACNVFLDIMQESTQSVLVITHGGLIHVILRLVDAFEPSGWPFNDLLVPGSVIALTRKCSMIEASLLWCPDNTSNLF